MKNTRFFVTVKTEGALRRVSAIKQRIVANLIETIKRLAIELQTKVKDQKLSGQVLNVRTGTLRRSINQRVGVGPRSIEAIVGTNVAYAGAHEFGFKGVVTIREHLRLQKMAFGKPMTPRRVTVRSHPARMNMPERKFLRSALDDMRARIVSEIRAAVNSAVKT